MRFICKKYGALALCTATLAAPIGANAADSLSLEIGSGNKTQKASFGVQWNWSKRWWDSNGTHIGGYWDLNIAYWHGNRFQDISNRSQNIGEAGITPVFRFQSNMLKGPYVEIGVGVHVLSDRYDNNGRQLSTKFQFGDHLGIGYVFENKWELGVKLQHFSNASMKQPNDGVNFAIIKLSSPI
ncbi:MAG TPA: acyloxyacyl hydrolase [Noviherbaspirillum sp.]|nr:acyloxyacyl hydrolase [Noviherbaspirillum sp.]